MAEEEDVKREKELRDSYHFLFTGDVGRKVLIDILYRAHWGATLDSSNPQQIGEYNLGVYILARSGLLDDAKQSMLGLRGSPQ